ncbi:MAG: sugar phosphate isomerase/epimerase [Armatimonadetes bacterium]|nr:sugar phosphate isomerase/epimerase [Armatimonadota bacterium]
MPNKIFRFYAYLSLSFVLFALFGASSLSAQTLRDSKGRPLQIGVQLYSVREQCAKDLPGTLKALAGMGFRGVEFAGYYGRSAKEMRELLDANRLKAYGTHLGLDALLGDKLDKTMEYCKVIGCKFLSVPWLPENRRNTKQATTETARLFMEIAKKVNANGMILGWHNEAYEFKPIEGETIWDTFTANSDKSVGLQFDTGNALSVGEQAAPYLLKYPERIVSVHLKDHSKTNPNALLGEGDENWNEVIPILKTKTATRWFIIEQESFGQPPLVCVEKCLRNFEKLWTKGRL